MVAGFASMPTEPRYVKVCEARISKKCEPPTAKQRPSSENKARTGPAPRTTKGSRPGVGTSHVFAVGVPVAISLYQLIVLSALTVSAEFASVLPTKPG